MPIMKQTVNTEISHRLLAGITKKYGMLDQIFYFRDVRHKIMRTFLIDQHIIAIFK